uniref:SEA domain-containing protein n=2 Tax=Wuchereria bancrofti TaxID=6293 RepID=A0AAF5RWR5_WUCBA
MRHEILIHLLVSFLSATTLNAELENRTVEEELLSSTLSLRPIQLKSKSELETTLLALEPSFSIQKLAKTIAPRERGFLFPEIKRARELGASKTTIYEQEPSSSLSPFISEIDRVATIEAQSDHINYENATQEEKINNYEAKETSILGFTEIPEVSLSVINEAVIITEMPEYIKKEEDTLPLEVRAADPFATANTRESAISAPSTSHLNILHMIQNNSSSKMNMQADLSFLSNSGDISSGVVEMKQTGVLDKITDINAVVRTFSAPSLSLKSEQKMISTKTTDETMMESDVQEISAETKVTIPEKDNKSTASYTTATFGTLIVKTTLDIFRTTMTIVTPVEQTAVLHPIATNTFSTGTNDQSTTIRQIMADENTFVNILRESEKHFTSPVTESPSITVSEVFTHSSFFQPSADAFITESVATSSVAIKHQSEIRKELPSTTTNKFNTANSREEQGNEHEHGHDDESLFVGDKTLFSRDGIMKPNFSDTHSVTGSITAAEMSEENFGVPGFSLVEGLGPEATEEIHEAVTLHPSTVQSPNVESKVQTDISVDLTENSHQLNGHNNGERTSAETARNLFEDSRELKDISVIDDSFYHTDIEEAATTIKSGSDERKSGPKPVSEPEPEPVSFPEREILETSERNLEQLTDFEPKAEPEFNALPGGSKGGESDLNGILHTHHTYVTDSHNAEEEGTYKTSFSFRITSIDYIPEFGDPNSGKYKKLQDQLLPDLEEIFGSIFGRIYGGIHLVSFLKGSVVVDGIVFTSTKPSDMEQLATEFEQQITAKNLQIGGNDVDPRSIILDGFVSKNYIERIHEGYTSDNASSYIVGGGIAIGILAVLLVAFTVIATNNRRTNGTLKLKEENIAMADGNKSMWQNGTSPVNLMGYGNSRMIQGGTTNNIEPPMVMVGSQMTAVNNHAVTRAIQSHP